MNTQQEHRRREETTCVDLGVRRMAIDGFVSERLQQLA